MIKKYLKRNVNNHRSLLLAPQVLQATHFQCGFQRNHLHRSQVLRRKTTISLSFCVFNSIASYTSYKGRSRKHPKNQTSLKNFRNKKAVGKNLL